MPLLQSPQKYKREFLTPQQTRKEIKGYRYSFICWHLSAECLLLRDGAHLKRHMKTADLHTHFAYEI